MEQIEEKEAIKQFNVPLPSYLIDKIEDYQKSNEIKNRSKALEEILYKAFEEEKQDADSYRYEAIERNKLPSFIFTDKANNQEIYNYLKHNPNASRFIFRKYKENQPFVKELCDPENPIYLEDVANNLRELYQYTETVENIGALKSELAKVRKEKEELLEYVEKYRKEYDEMESKLESVRNEIETLEMRKANIRTDPALEEIGKAIKDMKNLLETIRDKWNERVKANPFETGIRLEKDNINYATLLLDDINRLETRLKTEDFLSPENLDKYHKELMEKLRYEKDKAQNQMDGFMAYNPSKVLDKVANSLTVIQRKLNGADDDGTGGRWLSKVGFGNLNGEMDEALNLLSHLQDQVEAKKRREK